MTTLRTTLTRLWQAWSRLAKQLADWEVRALLFAFYFVALAPFALVVRWFRDPLAIKPATPRGWRKCPAPDELAFDRARRQF
jgi:hypothetical protein